MSSQLRFLNGGSTEASARPQSLPLSIKVFFNRQTSVRKPFRVDFQGAIQRSEGLSAVRAAIFLVMLLDLRDRLEGGCGASDPAVECARVAQLLEPAAKSADPANVMRVALYRFFDYFERENPLSSTQLSIRFDVDSLRFSLTDGSGLPFERAVQLDIASNDPAVEQILSTAFHSSPLAAVKRRKSLYVPAGPSGSDRLLLEMYNHPHRLRVTSLYVRPPFQSYPEHLLHLIGIDERVIERRRIAFEGYRAGRFHFLEILPKRVIWNLIRSDGKRRFKMYPPQVKQSHVLDHLDNLIHVLRTYEHYEFYVTDATIPFASVIYEIHSSEVPEFYSVFFQSFDSAEEHDLGCFVMSDPHVYQSISDHIVNWVVTHQSTVRERDDVIKFLRKVRKHLHQHGPLGPDEPAPN
ncbi:MAG: hypothetical protein U0136_21445 [Bdellovibrionota bacterium]